jgi:hypothetical protein
MRTLPNNLQLPCWRGRLLVHRHSAERRGSHEASASRQRLRLSQLPNQIRRSPITNQRCKEARELNPVENLREHFREKQLAQDIAIKLDVTPARFVEHAYFALRIFQKEEASIAPVFAGLYSAGRQSQFIRGWIDGDYFGVANFLDGSSISLSEGGLDNALFVLLGELIPPGGSLMVSYSLFSNETEIHKATKQGLDKGYPPVATPLGFLLFRAGCGMGFKDWYFAEGGREGPEKLQGFKPADQQTGREKGRIMAHELQDFIAKALDGDTLARDSKSRAAQVLRQLENYLQRLS